MGCAITTLVKRVGLYLSKADNVIHLRWLRIVLHDKANNVTSSLKTMMPNRPRTFGKPSVDLDTGILVKNISLAYCPHLEIQSMNFKTNTADNKVKIT